MCTSPNYGENPVLSSYQTCLRHRLHMIFNITFCYHFKVFYCNSNFKSLDFSVVDWVGGSTEHPVLVCYSLCAHSSFCLQSAVYDRSTMGCAITAEFTNDITAVYYSPR